MSPKGESNLQVMSSPILNSMGILLSFVCFHSPSQEQDLWALLQDHTMEALVRQEHSHHHDSTSINLEHHLDPKDLETNQTGHLQGYILPYVQAQNIIENIIPAILFSHHTTTNTVLTRLEKMGRKPKKTIGLMKYGLS